MQIVRRSTSWLPSAVSEQGAYWVESVAPSALSKQCFFYYCFFKGEEGRQGERKRRKGQREGERKEEGGEGKGEEKRIVRGRGEGRKREGEREGTILSNEMALTYF